MPCKSCTGGRRLRCAGAAFAEQCGGGSGRVCGLPRAGVDRARGAVFAGPGGCGHRLASGCRRSRLQAPEAGTPPRARAHGDALPGPDSCGNAHAGAVPFPRRCPAPRRRLDDAGRIRGVTLRQGSGDGYVAGRRQHRNSTEHTDADLRAAVTTQNLPFAVEKNSACRRCSSCTPMPPRAAPDLAGPVFDPGDGRQKARR